MAHVAAETTIGVLSPTKLTQRLFTFPEAAEFLRCSVQHVHNLVNKGVVKALDRPGGFGRLIELSELERLITQGYETVDQIPEGRCSYVTKSNRPCRNHPVRDLAVCSKHISGVGA